MGMTIEEIIKTFDYIKHVGNGESEYNHCRQQIALDEAVAIMRKYQKIKQIIEADKYQPANTYVCGGVWLTDEKRVSAIREVLEDGNN